MPEKKSDVVRQLVARGEYKKALQIVKGFRLGISKADLDAMRTGYECMLYPDMYRQMKVNPSAAIELAITTVRALYGPQNDA